MEFIQQPPEYKNTFTDSSLLKLYLKKTLPSSVYHEIESDLIRFSHRTISEVIEMGKNAELHLPQLIQYDAYGNRIDEIKLSDGWKSLARIASEEGLISIAYERKFGQYSRLYQFAKLFLFSPLSAVYTCPLAMTDGAARMIEVYGNSYMKDHAYKKLISRDPNHSWTSGQWMTEKTGGSDVRNTETIAEYDNDHYHLFGKKWFSSAATADMAMALAKIHDNNSISKDVSVFYLETKDTNGKLNNITIDRLKDKCGTKALPTAELTLHGVSAMLLGEKGKGVKTISTLFNITRAHNAIGCVANMHQMIQLTKDYAAKRTAFGKTINEHPLHLQTLAELDAEYLAGFLLAFKVVELLGKEENNVTNSDEYALFRLLLPLAKLYTAKQHQAVIAEAMECIGGIAYIEDSGIPKYYRDAMALVIWEGTTNVLSLDVLRAIQKENSFFPYIDDIKKRLSSITLDSLSDLKTKVSLSLANIEEYLPMAISEGVDFIQAAARNFSYSLAQTYIASLMLEFVEYSHSCNDPRALIAANRWCERNLTPLLKPYETYRKNTQMLFEQAW